MERRAPDFRRVWVRMTHRPMTQPIAFRNDIPFIKDLGVEFISAENGRAVVALTLAARHLNSWSVAHGGVLMTLLDVAMAVAGRSLDPAAGGGVTVEMKTSFLQPANAGTRLIVSGHAFHRSSTMAFCDGEVRDTDERLIAKAMGTFKYLKLGPKFDSTPPVAEKFDG
jgi:acyl-CoA thioesterase